MDANGDGVPDDVTPAFRFGVRDLLGQSEHIANLIGIYQDDKMEFRLAYNWRSEYLTTYRDWVSGNPIYVAANGFSTVRSAMTSTNISRSAPRSATSSTRRKRLT